MPKADEAARFWAKVSKGEGCWTWTAKRNSHGYGQFWTAGHRLQLAHRVSWRLANGIIPDGQFILHRCDNRACVRPDHLFLGSLLENYHDCVRKGRMPLRVGLQHHSGKLSDEMIKQIRARYVRGSTTMKSIGEEFGISTTYVSHLVNGRTRLPAAELPSNSLLGFGV